VLDYEHGLDPLLETYLDEKNVGAGLGESDGDSLANASGASGHKRCMVLQREHVL